MVVGSMDFLRCCNCGGHHKASKCMERKDVQTADDPADRGAVSPVLGRRGSTLQEGPDFFLK